MKHCHWGASGRGGMNPSVHALFVSLFLHGLVACGDSGSEPVPTPPDAFGTFAVGHQQFIVVDAARDDRSLLVDIWYPVDAEDAGTPFTRYPLLGEIGLDSEVAVDEVPVSARTNHPLLVFSHGFQGINLQSIDLMETLASHGFIILSPEHTGNAQASPTDSFDEAAANRVPDVAFMIDTMLARNVDPRDAFYDRVDEERIGVVGHSFGGMTAIGAVAGWAGAEPDPRVDAIVPISAVIQGDLQSDRRLGPNAGFSEVQLASIGVPTMLIGGTEDVNVPIANNEIGFERITNAPRVYKVDIIGANHNHFAGVCDIGDLLIEVGLPRESWPGGPAADLVGPYDATCTPDVFPIEEASRLTNLYTVAFFKRHLSDDLSYDRYLSSEFADTEAAITFLVK